MKIPRLFALVDRYIFSMHLQTIFFGILLFMVIWLAPETLFKLIQYVFDDKLTLEQAASMLLYHLPPVLQQSIPMAVLFGSIFLFRQISTNSELIAMMGAGISPVRLMWPVLTMGILFCGLHLAVEEWVTPYTAPRLEKMYVDYGIKNRKDENFVFVEKNNQGQLDKFILIGQTGLETLKDFIFLYYAETHDGGVQIARILRAPEGQWNSKEKAWQLFNGIDYELDEGGVFHETRKFKEQWVNTSKYPALLLEYSQINPMDMGQGTLRKYIQLLQAGGQFQDVRFSLVRLYQQLSFPMASIFFSVIGALLGMERVRSHKSYSLTFGAIVLFLYSILIPFSTNIGSLGVIPPLVAAWLPLMVAGGVAVVILQARRWEG
jgi:lipopolysaccharide export system permease protein